MNKEYTFFDRDLSWLSFNKRILHEAADKTVPLYDRIKFLAIYSSNLDEFFRVRVASIRSIAAIDKKKINNQFALSPKKVLKKIIKEVIEQQEEFGRIKREEIIPELKKNGIFLYRDEKIKSEHVESSRRHFKSKILSYLQPHILTLSSAKKIFLENRQLYFIIDLSHIDGKNEIALLNIPSNHLPRYIMLPKIGETHYFIAIDDLIRENLDFIFPNYKVNGCYSIKLNRDADLNIEDEYSGDLVNKIKKQIDKRNLGVPSRFLYDQSMPTSILDYVIERFELEDDDIVSGGRYHNMNDLFSLPNPLKPKLETDSIEPLVIKKLEDTNSVFDIITKEDLLLHFPYQSYDYVLRFFNEAALDPKVDEIKATFYRIAPESFICNALISAANNGKKVTVFVEIKARFDEQNNLMWAERMEKAGIRIIYSMPGLKVHAKVALVKRKGDNGKKIRFGYFGTGNFNEKTAEIYADQALITADQTMTSELASLFEFLLKPTKHPQFKDLLVSQFNITDRFSQLIEREIKNVNEGKKGHIIIKLNNLQDDIMIEKLYEASNAGVKIDMIVRSICCLVPGVKGQSENITIHRIVDSYLEHSRAFYFYNNGEDELYQGSADWMKRNLYHRVEVVFPIKQQKLKEEIMQMLTLQLNDDVKGTLLSGNLEIIPMKGTGQIRSQKEFYKWLNENT